MKKKDLNSMNDQKIFPKKSLGQNFLTDKNILRKIIKVAEIKANENILEVGPGRGVLTFELVLLAKKVVAIEKDKMLFAELQNKQTEFSNLIIQNQDILRIDFAELRKEFKNKPYKIVANLPYNITSRFLRTFLQSDYCPSEMILMVQREVGERIAEKEPGEFSVLSNAVQFYCRPRVLFRVSANCFFPRPRVESVVIRLSEIGKNMPDCEAEKFFLLLRAGFSAKRKQLKNNLMKINKIDWGAVLVEAGLRGDIRAEELTVADWVKLCKFI